MKIYLYMQKSGVRAVFTRSLINSDLLMGSVTVRSLCSSTSLKAGSDLEETSCVSSSMVRDGNQPSQYAIIFSAAFSWKLIPGTESSSQPELHKIAKCFSAWAAWYWFPSERACAIKSWAWVALLAFLMSEMFFGWSSADNESWWNKIKSGRVNVW